MNVFDEPRDISDGVRDEARQIYLLLREVVERCPLGTADQREACMIASITLVAASIIVTYDVPEEQLHELAEKLVECVNEIVGTFRAGQN